MRRLPLAALLCLVLASPCLARGGHGRGRGSADATPADANAAVCHARARDAAARTKSADPGAERLAYERCMGQ
jgi:hypothetical protein